MSMVQGRKVSAESGSELDVRASSSEAVDQLPAPLLSLSFSRTHKPQRLNTVRRVSYVVGLNGSAELKPNHPIVGNLNFIRSARKYWGLACVFDRATGSWNGMLGGDAASYREVLRQASGRQQPIMALGDVSLYTVCTIYGVVALFKPVRKTNGTDHIAAFQLVDPTLSPRESIAINVFHALDMLPNVTRIGDVVKCRVRLQRFGARVQGVSVKDGSYLAVVLEEPIYEHDGNADWAIASALKSWWDGLNVSASVISIPPPIARPVLKVCDINTSNVFCDMSVQVVFASGSSHQQGSHQTTLLVVDYTENFDLPPPMVQPPPPAPQHSILICTFWDEHADVAARVPIGSYVHLRNLRIKHGASGLEAAMHGSRTTRGDHKHITVLSYDDPAVIEMEQRRSSIDQDVRLKEEEEMRGLSPYSRRQMAQQRENLSPTPQARPALARHGSARPSFTTPAPTRVVPKAVETPPPPLLPRETTLAALLASPSDATVAPVRCRVKIIDHAPSDFRNFCVPTCKECLRSLLPPTACPRCPISPQFAYRFSVLATDATGSCVPLVVFAGAAESIMQDIPAMELRDSPDGVLEMVKGRFRNLCAAREGDTGPLIAGVQKEVELLIKAVAVGNSAYRYAVCAMLR
ncbi:3-ketoacyl-CoA thiolase with broad chain length specificity [Thoreauomyces humboldtii]|nr:3-ketoacyl-CoA thiolase with broad chain length specificity [Thoreauomyces humboldtii]